MNFSNLLLNLFEEDGTYKVKALRKQHRIIKDKIYNARILFDGGVKVEDDSGNGLIDYYKDQMLAFSADFERVSGASIGIDTFTPKPMSDKVKKKDKLFKRRSGDNDD